MKSIKAKWLWRITVCASVALIVSLTFSHRVHAGVAGFDPDFPFGTTDMNGSPMLGIVQGQTLRFNAVNIGHPANTCDIQLSVLGPTGKALKQSNVRSLGPGLSTFLDFSPGGIGPSRTQVRTIAQMMNSTNCAIMLSLEVFDNRTLRTQIHEVVNCIW